MKIIRIFLKIIINKNKMNFFSMIYKYNINYIYSLQINYFNLNILF